MPISLLPPDAAERIVRSLGRWRGLGLRRGVYGVPEVLLEACYTFRVNRFHRCSTDHFGRPVPPLTGVGVGNVKAALPQIASKFQSRGSATDCGPEDPLLFPMRIGSS